MNPHSVVSYHLLKQMLIRILRGVHKECTLNVFRVERAKPNQNPTSEKEYGCMKDCLVVQTTFKGLHKYYKWNNLFSIGYGSCFKCPILCF